MEEILDIVIKLAAAVLAVGVTYILAKLRTFFQKRLGSEEFETLDRLIEQFAKAAEQQFKETDRTGEIRFAYVADLLGKLGYEVTDAVKAQIEAKVFEINRG